MFSPADPNVFVVSGSRDGVILYDIRNLKRYMRSFPALVHWIRLRILQSYVIFHSFLYSNPGAMGTWSAQFDGSGTRLLYCEKNPSQLVIYELTTRQQQQPTTVGKIRLTAPNFTNKDVGRSACCFSGLQDELLVVPGRIVVTCTSGHCRSISKASESLLSISQSKYSKVIKGTSWRSATTVTNLLCFLTTLVVLLSFGRLVHNFELVPAFSNWFNLILDVNVIEWSRINMFSQGIIWFL